MGVVVAVLMGMILTLPISSAALGVILDLGGLAAGAATIGCTTQMVGFAVASYRENKVSGLLAGAEWVHTEVKSALNYRHLNLGAPTATGPDGRPLYYNALGRSAAGWNGGDSPLTGVYNSGSGQGATVMEVLREVSMALGREPVINFSPGRAFDVKRIVLDIGLAKRTFGWSPAISLGDGIRETVAHRDEA